ncbi:MAG: hypothetical protein RLZZ453_506 [Chlamydiota bacterium]|jgi:hypothetical protein
MKIVGLALYAASENAKKQLSKHPTIHKVVIVAFHVLRTAMMYTFMMVMPCSLLGKCAIGLGVNLAYRLLVERACQFKFALPSFWGAFAWMMRREVTLIPFAIYLASVVEIANNDVNYFQITR